MLKKRYAAYFIHPDGRIYTVLSQEILIGTSKRADLQIRIPGMKRSVQIQNLSGVAPYHAYLEKVANQFYITNVSKKKNIIIIQGSEYRNIYPGEKSVLMHGAKVVLGNYEILFCKEVV